MSRPILQIRAGGLFQQVTMDHEKLTIGRDPLNKVVITDSQASRNHAVIEKLGGGRFQVRDLNSSNGTKLNGEVIKTSPLKTGDVIMVGKTAMRFMQPDGATTDDEPEMLSMDDLVEVETSAASRDSSPLKMEGQDAMPFATSRDDYEEGLEELSNALPDRAFGEHDIELINGRGAIVHQAGNEVAKGKNGKRARREAVELLRLLLLVCFRSRTSDIHIEPRQEGYSVRLRIDGNMVDVAKLPPPIGLKLTSLVKILGDIDIAQKNTIQEGHFATAVPSARSAGGRRRVDYRVSFAPAVFGQKLVIRILDSANAPAKVGDLGLPSWMYQELASIVKQDAGMVLVSGPTGSGKTTSLYALVRSIETSRRNVVTIEDPVEVQLEGVTQIPVDEEHQKGFPEILRSVLRQDPDVILVGEIRDSETARTAMQAAITGHLVFSTVHTKDTIGSIFRLLDLGVEPFLISQGLQIVLAQRLARFLCKFCKKAVPPTAEQIKAMGELAVGMTKTYVPCGCPKCLGTGFGGRKAFFELFKVNDEIRELILKSPTMSDIQEALSRTQFTSLRKSALQLVRDGQVAFDEVDRIVGHAG